VDDARIRHHPDRELVHSSDRIPLKASGKGCPIASMLGLTSLGHVSTIVKRCDEALVKDSRLRDLANQCRALIRELPSPVFSPPGRSPAPA
jgi:hypothetical protein